MLINIFDLNPKNQKSHDFFKKVMIFASPDNDNNTILNTQISIIAHNVITTKKCYIYFE